MYAYISIIRAIKQVGPSINTPEKEILKNYFIFLNIEKDSLRVFLMISVSALNYFFFLVVIRASGDSSFTCPDLFSLARIIF